MKRDDLIAKLSSDVSRPKKFSPITTILSAATLAFVIVALIASGGLGLRSDIASVFSTNRHHFHLNITFIVSVGIVAMFFVRDLSVPGRSLRLPASSMMVPFVVLVGLALQEYETAPLHELSNHRDHDSLLHCLVETSALAATAFFVLAIGVQRLAPTNLRHAGFYVGSLAGAIGALGYCLHTPYDSLVFGVAVYSTGIMIMAIVGALVGPHLLRWR